MRVDYYITCLPFQNKAKLECVDVVDLLNFQNVNHGERDVDVDRDNCFLHSVKTEWSYLLVVVVLGLRFRDQNLSLDGERYGKKNI